MIVADRINIFWDFATCESCSCWPREYLSCCDITDLNCFLAHVFSLYYVVTPRKFKIYKFNHPNSETKPKTDRWTHSLFCQKQVHALAEVFFNFSDVSSQLIIDAKPKSGKNSSSSENPEPIQEADQHGGSTVPPRASKSTTNPPNIHGEVSLASPWSKSTWDLQNQDAVKVGCVILRMHDLTFQVPQPRSKPEEWTRSWQCPDCTHKTKRADHLKEHMIGQHMRSKKDPFFSTLSYTRWETCPGCDQAKAKLSQHKKKCPMFLALEAKATVVIEALPR